MYLKKIKPFNPSTRFKLIDFIDTFFLDKKLNNYFFFKKNKAGRKLKNGSILVYSKSKIPNKLIYYNLYLKNKLENKMLSILIKFKKIKKNVSSLLKDSIGNFYFIPSINGVFLGDFFFFIFKTNKNIIILGKKTFLLFSLNNFFVSNLVINKIKYKNIKISKSNGTFCIKKSLIIDFNIICIILPSKNKKFLHSLSTCFIGRNTNVSWKYSIFGNFNQNFILGKKQNVRGVAMNPVDHPHGGRTKTNKPEVSPWGWIAKRSH